MKLKTNVHGCLCEALRRYTRFYQGEPLTKAWTGLGSIAAYRCVLEEGYMRRLHKANEPHDEWWALTAKGAAIVAKWIADGYSFKNVEHGGELSTLNLPPREV